jgi:hypothetical protein
VQNPAADVAAQAAAALALMAKIAQTHGNEWDQKVANFTWVPKAKRAYAYAKLMWQRHGKKATCTKSSASTNCIGAGCTKVDENGDSVFTVRFGFYLHVLFFFRHCVFPHAIAPKKVSKDKIFQLPPKKNPA